MVDESETTSTNNSNKSSRRAFVRVGLLIFIIAAAFGSYFLINNKGKDDEVHYHAGFQVYKDGKLEDFSDIKFMTIGFCGEEDNVDEQLEKAHLHDNIGDVVHVHRDGGLWRDLFTNIKYNIEVEEVKSAYVNGQEVEDILNYPIKAFDSVVIIVGEHTSAEDLLSHMVTRSRIEEVEAKSESCGS